MRIFSRNFPKPWPRTVVPFSPVAEPEPPMASGSRPEPWTEPPAKIAPALPEPAIAVLVGSGADASAQR